MSMTNDTDDRLEAGRARRPVRLGNFVYPKYAYATPSEISTGIAVRYPVAVVGGGMVGLTTALDLARKGVKCVITDDNDTVSAGSRSIAQARRTMDIFSRLGCAAPMVEKGISWSKGHTHYGSDCVLSFEIFLEGGTRYPSITSLAQYYVEHFLVERCREFSQLELRWLNRLVDIKPAPDGSHMLLDMETPDGVYVLAADWVVAADGARSAVRRGLGLEFPGNQLKDKFVIADVRIDLDLPHERNYWFSPPFYDGNTVLRVPQSDSIWRIDWQIDPDADVEAELSPSNVEARLTRIFAGRTAFEAEWVGTYTSEHRLMASFRHGRVFFVGDAAHQFSPFGGGRGGNSGIQDADNLAWKLAAVIEGRAGERLLDSYSAERRPIAERNLADSFKATEFITPKSAHSRALRDAVLRLASHASFAKSYVNTGRFAVWPVLESSPLSAPDRDAFMETGRPGTPVLDCLLTSDDAAQVWLSDKIGDAFTLVVYGRTAPDLHSLCNEISARIFPLTAIRITGQAEAVQRSSFSDRDGAFARQYDAAPHAIYLFRPDQHVLARWRTLSPAHIEAAIKAALALA